MKNFIAFPFLSAFCMLTAAYKLSIYGGQSCRGQSLGTREMKVDSGCQRDFAGNGASVVVKKDEGDKDLFNAVLFFDGDDCNPTKILNDTAIVIDDGCWTGNYGSYEVWGLWKPPGN